MNLVGKIFTVLIFVMSLVFASFAVCVYATHKNWREAVMLPRNEATALKPAGLKFQIQDARAVTQNLKDQLEKMDGELEQVKLTARNEQVKLKSELTDQQKENAKLVEANDALTKEKGQALTDLEMTQIENKKYREANETLTAAKREAERVRDEKMDECVAKTDDLLQAENELRRLKERMAQVLQQFTDAKAVLDKFGLKADPKFYVISKVDGVVLAVNSKGQVEISIGSDDGINKGGVLRVIRANGTMYLGKIEVVETKPDKAVCNIIKKEQLGAMMRGDRVYSDISDTEK